MPKQKFWMVIKTCLEQLEDFTKTKIPLSRLKVSVSIQSPRLGKPIPLPRMKINTIKDKTTEKQHYQKCKRTSLDQ